MPSESFAFSSSSIFSILFSFPNAYISLVDEKKRFKALTESYAENANPIPPITVAAPELLVTAET